MTDKGITTLRSVAGKLARVAIFSKPFLSFVAFVALQRTRDQPHEAISIFYDI